MELAHVWRPSATTARHQHPIEWLVFPESRVARVLGRVIAALGVVFGLYSLLLPIMWHFTSRIYTKDIVQEYLFARSFTDGLNPYSPIPDLAWRYLGVWLGYYFPHPTPHTPPAGVLFVPMAGLDYSTASAIWFWLELGFVLGAVVLLSRTVAPRLSPWRVLCLTIALVAWRPVSDDLAYGQLTLLMLLLLAGAETALLSRRSGLAGILVGLTVLLKLFTWPLLLLFLIKGERRALGTSITTVVLGYLAAGWILGFGRITAYFTDVLPKVSEAYRASPGNLSLWSIGSRLFSGTGFGVHDKVVAPPLLASDSAATIASMVVPMFALAVVCLIVSRQRSLDVSLGLMVCVSVLVSPIAWDHYLVLLAIPCTQVIAWLVRHQLPVRYTNLALLVGLLLGLSHLEWFKFASLVAWEVTQTSVGKALPAGAMLLTLGPTVAVIALGLLLAKMGATGVVEEPVPGSERDGAAPIAQYG